MKNSIFMAVEAAIKKDLSRYCSILKYLSEHGMFPQDMDDFRGLVTTIQSNLGIEYTDAVEIVKSMIRELSMDFVIERWK